MSIETEIKTALAGLMAAIQASDRQAIAAEMDRIEALHAQGKDILPARLRHFLENRSYAKALQLLGGDEHSPAGNCGGRGWRS